MFQEKILKNAISDHSRHFLNNRYVYPVLSRRSNGISIGINLNPDKACNFNCVYCQVDRSSPGKDSLVDISRIIQELEQIFKQAASGQLFLDPRFKDISEDKRVVKDIAFSGDGEPSVFPRFFQLTQEVIALKRRIGFPDLKLVIITNASGLGRPEVQKALDLLDHNQGELWAKLDAGTKGYYHKICRTPVGFQKILNNIQQVSRKRPVTIQTCFMKIAGEGPGIEEVEAYAGRISDFLKNQGQLKLIQLYTVARIPAEDYVAPLENEELDQIARIIKNKVNLPVETYYHA